MHPHSVLLKIKVYHITIRFDKDIPWTWRAGKGRFSISKVGLRGNVSKPADSHT